MTGGGESHLNWELNNLRRALQAAGVSLWSWSIDTDAFSMDRKGYEL